MINLWEEPKTPTNLSPLAGEKTKHLANDKYKHLPRPHKRFENWEIINALSPPSLELPPTFFSFILFYLLNNVFLFSQEKQNLPPPKLDKTWPCHSPFRICPFRSDYYIQSPYWPFNVTIHNHSQVLKKKK